MGVRVPEDIYFFQLGQNKNSNIYCVKIDSFTMQSEMKIRK